MKVCIICLPNKGGMVQYAAQLSNSLSKRNEIYFITSKGFEDYDYFEGAIRIKELPFDSPVNILNLAWIRFDILISTIRKINPDVIHITKVHPLLIPILFCIKKPLVLTIHDSEKHPGDKDFLHLFQIASKIFIMKANKIFVHGENLKKLVQRKYVDPDKIIVIPHGDYSFFTEFRNGSAQENDIILFFGRIRKYKGLNYLIDAQSIISNHFPTTNLIIAGEGDISEFADRIINNKNIIIINRYISDTEVADLFLKSKVVVLPYIEGSQSGVISIAYAFEKPVVVTKVGSIPEVVIDGVTGYIVPPKDPVSLAERILRLLRDDNLRKQMGRNGYLKMKKDLSWDEVAEKTINVYKEII